MKKPKPTTITLTARQLATVLAGLRMVQRVETAVFHNTGFPPGIESILTDGARLKPLTMDEIDALCRVINK